MKKLVWTKKIGSSSAFELIIEKAMDGCGWDIAYYSEHHLVILASPSTVIHRIALNLKEATELATIFVKAYEIKQREESRYR